MGRLCENWGFSIATFEYQANWVDGSLCLILSQFQVCDAHQLDVSLIILCVVRMSISSGKKMSKVYNSKLLEKYFGRPQVVCLPLRLLAFEGKMREWHGEFWDVWGNYDKPISNGGKNGWNAVNCVGSTTVFNWRGFRNHPQLEAMFLNPKLGLPGDWLISFEVWLQEWEDGW